MREETVWTRAGCLAALPAALILLASCAAAGAPAADEARYDTGDDSAWEIVDDGRITLENDRIAFDMDAATTHFTVTEKAGGQAYASVPPQDEGVLLDETANRMLSEVAVVFYNADSKEMCMTSAGDSVDNDNFVVKRSGDTLRVYYTLKSDTALLLVPDVFTPEAFERVTGESGALSASQTRRLLRYYDLYTPEDPTEDYERMKERYPVLADRPLYVLSDTVDKLKRMEIDEYIALAGFTAEDYAAMLGELGVEAQETDDAGYVVPVEYALTADGFTARVLMDKVVEESPRFTLQRIDLLEYFAACGGEEDGYFFVPDGSGALITLGGTQGSYSARLYGDDPAMQREKQEQLTQAARLPVFGISRTGENAGDLLAVIEAGTGAAGISAATVSAARTYNTIHAAFHVREMDTTDIGEDRNIPVFNLYSDALLKESPQVRYVLLSGEAGGYAGMAAYYRRYLEERGALPEADGASLFLDVYGLATYHDSILGVPYTKKAPLTVLSALTEEAEALAEAGRIDVRLSGYGGEGLAHAMNDRYRLDGKVGTDTELATLAETLAGAGGTLYLEADFQYVYRDKAFDGFSPKRDSAQYLNRNLASVKVHDIVDRGWTGGSRSRYVLSPTIYARTARAFLDSLNGHADLARAGVSYGGAAQSLSGDYSKKHGVRRDETADILTGILGTASEGRSVMSDGGNLYALPALSRLAGVAGGSSGYDLFGEDVPFYMMVVHGSLPYTLGPLNLAADPETAFLQSMACGSGLSFALTTESDRAYARTDFAATLYSLNAEAQRSRILAYAQRAAPIWSATADAAFIGYERAAAGLTLSRFDNGAVVAVNFGDSEQEAAGVRIPARDFALLVPPAEGGTP